MTKFKTDQSRPLTLYVNKGYGNQVSLDGTLDAEIDNFGDITWQQLLEDVLGEVLPADKKLKRWLMDNYDITPDDLDETIGEAEVQRWSSSIAYWIDFEAGAGALAYDLVRDLELFPVDKEGGGSANGVHLQCTTANGPRKFLLVDDEAAAQWLAQACCERGTLVEIEFV